MVFPVVMYGCESWTVKKVERRRIDAFELWCWRRLLQVPWTTRTSNQSILKETSPGCSLEGLMLRLKLQYFDHLTWRVDSLEKTLMLEGLGTGGEGDGRGWDGWMTSLTPCTWVWVNTGCWWWTGRPGVLQFIGSQRVGHDWATELNWNKTKFPVNYFLSTTARFEPWVGKIPWRRAWQLTLVFLTENPRDRGTWQARVHRLRKSWTQLKRLSKHVTKTFICHCNKIFPLFIVCLKNKK